jgi:hypothetical protein
MCPLPVIEPGHTLSRMVTISVGANMGANAGLGNEVPAIYREFLSVSLAEVLGLGHLPVPPSVMPAVPS